MNTLFPIKPKVIKQISFTVNFIPKPQARGQSAAIPLKKDGKQVYNKHGKAVYTSMVHKSTKQDNYEKALIPLLSLHAPEKPLTGALLMTVVVYLPIPPSWPPWKREAAAKKVSFPIASNSGDIDNFLKCITDCMGQCGYFINDSQFIGYHRPYKLYTDGTPRWEIKLWEIWQPQSAKEYRNYMATVDNPVLGELFRVNKDEK